MSTPATAYAPGSPANSAGGIAQKFLSSGLGAVLGGAGGAAGIPGFSSSSSATSGDAYQTGSTTGAGFNVNFGSGVSQGGVPVWVWVAAIAVGAWAWKHKRSI